MRLEERLANESRSERSSPEEPPVQAFYRGLSAVQVDEFKVDFALRRDVSSHAGASLLSGGSIAARNSDTYSRHLVHLDALDSAVL